MDNAGQVTDKVSKLISTIKDVYDNSKSSTTNDNIFERIENIINEFNNANVFSNIETVINQLFTIIAGSCKKEKYSYY